ncbi:MAG: hypothetical protein H0U10_07200 [Chloroflexia bacterium]|nr:hypothetical protein [Chloroflexia bacterium]
MTSSVGSLPIAAKEAIARYAPLIEAFLARELTAKEFEDRYLKVFREDPGTWTDEVYDLLHEAFLDIDAFWPEPDEDPLSIDEPELRRRMALALATMQAV